MSFRLPYPGLRAFTREESDLFFGREGSVDAMVHCLERNRFMAVLGPSGSGKSSLVRTGLLDALVLGLLGEAGAHWKIADMHPGREPIQKLAQALLSTRSGLSADATDLELMTSFLRQGPRSIEQWVRAGNLPSGCNLLILVDQFEELFRYADYEQRETAESFVAALLDAASVPDVPIYVLLTMRSEYLGGCASIPGLAERISQGLYLTPRMDRDECREAIEGPAGVLGFEIESALVNRMLNDLATFAPWQVSPQSSDLAGQLARQADQLPLMQHVLNRLWLRAYDRALGGSIVLKLDDYETIGGLSGALDSHGREVLTFLGAQREPIISLVFRALVSGNSVANAVRRPSSLQQLVEISGGSRKDVMAIIEAFRAQGCNFLRTSDETLTDSSIVDISHESLIRQWTPLSGWLEQEVRDDGEWRRLLSDEERYSSHKGGLLTGLNFQTAASWWVSSQPTHAWAERHGGRFERVQAYLEASRKEEEHQAEVEVARQRDVRNRLWASLALMTVGLIAVSIIASIAYHNFIQASSAQARAQKERGNAEQSLQNLKQTQAELALTNRTLSEKQDEVQKTNKGLQAALDAVQSEQAALRKKTTEAESSALAAIANATMAKSSEDTLRAALTSMGELYSDKSNYELAGAENIQANSIQVILNYEEQLAHMPPDQMVHDYYQSSVALDRAGDTTLAVEMLKKGYDSGLAAIDSSHAPSEELLAYFLDDAYDYAWLLYQIGNFKDGDQIRKQMEQKEQIISRPKTARLEVARARVENLESFYYELQSGSDSAEKINEHGLKAVEYSERANGLEGADVETATFTIRALLNNREKIFKGRQTKGCRLAADLYAKHPSDTRVVNLHIECLNDDAEDAARVISLDSSSEEQEAVAASTAVCRGYATDVAPQEIHDNEKPLNRGDAEKDLLPADISKACYDQAKTVAENALKKDPNNTHLLLWMARLEIGMSRLESSGTANHELNAKKYFVNAVNGKTISSYGDLPYIYNSISSIAFADQKELARYYTDIADALSREQEFFPNDHTVGSILNDARMKAALALARDATQQDATEQDATLLVQTEESLTKALQGLARYSYESAPAKYSEGYANYCMAYGTLAEVESAIGKLEAMVADLEKMRTLCSPVLEKFPWEFRIRIQFALVSADAGQTLFEHERYQEALPYLQFASDWGSSSSSFLLARMYQEGKLAAPETHLAEKLRQRAVQQSTPYLSTAEDIDFGRFRSTVPMLVQEWPVEDLFGVPPRNMIKDEVEWWKQARNGTVNSKLAQFMLSLYTYAKENNIPFSQLAASFDGLGAKRDAFSKPIVAKWFPEFGVVRSASRSTISPPSVQELREKDPAFAAAFSHGEALATQERYADALKQFDLALNLEPGSADVLQKEANILRMEGSALHDMTFDFERSFETHRRAIELGGGNGLDFIESMFSAGHYRDCATLASAARDVTAPADIEKLRPVGFSAENPMRIRQIMGTITLACLTALKDGMAVEAGLTLRKDISGLQSVRWKFVGTERYIQSNDALFNKKSVVWKELLTALELGDERRAQDALTKLGVPEASDANELKKTLPPKI